MSFPIEENSPSSSSFKDSSPFGISGGRRDGLREGFGGFWYGGGILDRLAFTGL
jgi:hypothetical protein